MHQIESFLGALDIGSSAAWDGKRIDPRPIPVRYTMDEDLPHDEEILDNWLSPCLGYSAQVITEAFTQKI